MVTHLTDNWLRCDGGGDDDGAYVCKRGGGACMLCMLCVWVCGLMMRKV